ncbi:MAG: hypothetical protein QW112_03635 [Candidatus Micrarchaeia archaeon]
MTEEIIATNVAEFIKIWTPQIASVFPWQVVAVLCVFISIAFSAIAYMLASIFRSDEAKKWVRNEIYYTYTNIFLIAFIITFMTIVGAKMIQFSDEVIRIGAPALYYSLQGSDPVVLPLYYLEKISNCARVAYIRLACSNFAFEAIYESFVKIAGEKSFSAVGVGGLVNVAHVLAQLMSFILSNLYIQKHVLYFANGTMLTVFLPIGIILRTFAPTRGMGNLFIAIAIGMGIVLPLSYGVVLAIRSSQIELVERTTCGITEGTPSPSAGSGTCASMMIGSYAVSAAILPFKLIPTPKVIKSTTLVNWATSVGASYVAYNKLYGDVSMLANELMMYAVVYPIIVFAITLTFIRSFAMFLGADVQDFLKGLSRLI